MKLLTEQHKKRTRGFSKSLFCFSLAVFLLSAVFQHTAMAQASAAKKTVTGRVTNEKGEPVQGASVMLKGSTTGVTTNAKGDYSISVANNSVLVISHIEYGSKEIKVGSGSSVYNVQMSAAEKALDEVVVIGYGTQRKEAVTGSVASINGDAMREIPAANVTQALQGRLPGVEISQTNTKPGATMQIRVRGVRSLNASNDPLIVLDGIPFTGSIGDINPTDIKNIDILKDASATAIYGSRGANGVILVSTNRGQKGQVPKISYTGRYGAQTLFAPYPMMSGPEFVQLRKDAGLYTNGADESDAVNTDWQKLFFRDGLETSHDIGLSGGTSKGNYSFGMGYYKNQGVVPTQNYTRYSLRGSVDQEIGDYIRVGFTTNSNYNVSAGNQVGLYNVLSMSPIADPYNADGTFKRTIKMPLDEQYVFTRSIVEGLGDLWLNETKGYATYNSVYGELKIPGVEGLKYRTNLGLDFIQQNTGAYTGVGIGSTNATTPSTASVDNRQTYHWTIENMLTYDRTFGQKHRVNAIALYSAEESRYSRSSMAAKNIPSDAFQFYNLGQSNATDITVDPNNQDYQVWGLNSLMGRVMYSYDDRYMLSATVRSDASSRLAPGHQWHTYPAVSVGWNINNESFMQQSKIFNRLKLRAGYGETSNQSISPYATLGRLTTTPYNFGPTTYTTGYYVSQLPNENLGWEYSQTWNFGLDFSILKNRLSGTIEYYMTNTKDILLGVSLPPTSGVSSYTGNIGQTQNKGIELSLNGTIIDNKNGWTWDAGLNIYANRNKLVALASGQTRDEGNGWFVGHNINAIYDYKRLGLWQSGDANLTKFEPGGNVGMIKVEYTGAYDVNGVPVRAIGPDDREIIDVDPSFQGGFNTRVSYKGFDLGIVGLFKSGGILISNINGPAGYLNLESGRRNNIKIDYWTTTNTGAKYPKPGGIMSSDNPKYASTLSYFDGSYLKVQTISLGYTFTKNNWMRKAGLNNLRVYATVQNPFVMFSSFYKETGLDPQPNSYGNQNVATGGYQSRLLAVGFNTPATRNYVFGLNMTF